jgi:hypothetical protein
MSLQQKSQLDLTQPMHIYYDLDIINNDVEGNNPPVPLRFEEVRNNPIIGCPANYYMSVVRFQIQTGDALPVFVPQVQLGQTNPNLLIYSITLKYKTYEFRSYVNFIPDDLTQPLPNPPLDFQDLTSQYYFVSTYQQWIEMVNITFQSAFTGLNLLVVAGGDVLPTTYAPFMEFDPGQLVAILDTDEAGYARTLANPIEIYMNSPMFNLFSTFPATIINYTTATNGKNYLFTIFNNNNTNILSLPNYNAIQSYQEGSTVALLNPIQSIVFTTALLPIIPSNVSTPKIYGTYSALFNVGNNANLSPVISDFVVPVDALNRYRPNIVYTPSAEYRLVGMYGSSPVSAIEVSAFWKDVFGQLHPILLNSGCSASLKILFRRKDYANITLL